MKSKSTSIFPDPRLANEDGVLCIGGALTVESLLDAYGNGIFPWPQAGAPLLWFSPGQRGVLDFDEFHIPRRFAKEQKQLSLTITKNRDFAAVIRQCSRIPRKNESGTWILPEMITAYEELHAAGYAHSYEAWDGDSLVGGLYGVKIGGLFSGESMFFKVSGASKLCLVEMIKDQEQAGDTWVDIQMVTPVLKMFGGKYISRDGFLSRLKKLR